MVQLTDFGVAVKKRLIDLNESQAWLVDQVRRKTGKYFDSAYLQKLMTGRTNTASMVEAVAEILELKEENADE